MKPGGLAALLLTGLVFIGGSFTGLKLVTQPTSSVSAGPTCDTRRIDTGDALTPNLVKVDVYNASRTAGLANRISVLLQRRNFLAGQVANNTTDLTTDDVLILGPDKDDPRVRLVRSQFGGKVTYRDGTVPGAEGVAVLVGRNYAEASLARDALKEVKTDRPLTACIPVAPVA